ncbi:hypothetical protein PIB30_036093 [Stylosanthes scabra]|uniref:Uncharacterized protein n=1 Tax=Stylosanthes scabra TaxID=79078 RepID=A0ABU6TF63_9FABA|nr:hypothetical protein [Stylosanthes scabra]
MGHVWAMLKHDSNVAKLDVSILACLSWHESRLGHVIKRDFDDILGELFFSQSSVILGDSLPKLRREMRLTKDRASEGDYVLEAAGPSDCLPLWAGEHNTHFLWVYQELFTRLGSIFFFSDFQKEVMTRCRVASQLHLNGLGFIQTFGRVCLHFGFRPSCHVFIYIYDLLPPSTGLGFMSFRGH